MAMQGQRLSRAHAKTGPKQEQRLGKDEDYAEKVVEGNGGVSDIPTQLL